MTSVKMNIDKEVKTPDMTRFGFYLRPVVYRREHGFSEARALLMLDANGIIDKSVAKNCGLTSILTSPTSALYSINPIDGKYPSASELLQKLKLGRVAQQKTSTIRQIEEQFDAACKQVGIDMSALDAVVRLGKNASNEDVYEMLNGRYLIGRDGKARRDDEPKKLLYALLENGSVDEIALRECIECFLDTDENDFFDSSTISTFTNVILQAPPPKYEVEAGNFTPISFIQKQDILSKNFEIFFNMMTRIEAERMQSVETQEDLAKFFQSVYRRKLATPRVYQHDLPAPIISILGQILFHDNKKSLYSPMVGSVFLLSLFLGKKRSDNELQLNVCEPYLDTKASLEEFIANTADSYKDGEFDINSFNLNDEMTAATHDICMTFTPNETIHIGTKIPRSSAKTHSKAHQIILDSLAVRADDGRSIFIMPVDDNNKLGELSKDSFELIGYLYQQYKNVLVFDLTKSLLNPSLFNYPVRICIIGGKMEFDQGYEYEQFVRDADIPILSNPTDLFNACHAYLSEVENEAASSLDLMTAFAIDDAIAEAEVFDSDDATNDDETSEDSALVSKDDVGVSFDTDDEVVGAHEAGGHYSGSTQNTLEEDIVESTNTPVDEPLDTENYDDDDYDDYDGYEDGYEDVAEDVPSDEDIGITDDEDAEYVGEEPVDFDDLAANI